MYAALAMSAASAASTAGSAMPYVHMGALELGPLPIQAFGVIVAVGVLIGAAILRRYAEWHGVADDHIRGLLGWITITGFLGAHIFDVVAYQGDKPWFEFHGWKPGQWPLILQLWSGISSYGGFLGGAMGFAFYVWWKRLPARLMADIGVVGLLPAFSIGRIGCTVVSDHIGRAIPRDAWYSFIAMDYPRADKLAHSGIGELVRANPGTSEFIPAWNLGLVELLYLIPVNALILYFAFRKKRVPAGFVAVLAGMLYAPVRFFLDYLRPENSDPRYFDLTFAQWSSLLAFGVCAYVATLLLKNGKAAETIAPTAKEAQEMLNLALKEDEESDGDKDKKADKKAKTEKVSVPKATAKKVEKKADAPDLKKEEEKRVARELEEKRALEKKQKEDADEIAAAERRKKQDDEFAAKEAAKKAEAVAKKAEAKTETKTDDAKTDDAKSDDAKTEK